MAKIVGIDDMAFFISPTYIDLREFAEHVNMDPDYYTKGLGNYRMRFPDAHQDIYTAGASALYELMKKNKVGPGQIGAIYFATEGALSASHNYISDVIETVCGEGSFEHCDVGECKAACRSSADAIQYALRYFLSGENNGYKYAAVIAADWANYMDPSTLPGIIEKARVSPEAAKRSRTLRSAGTGGYGAFAAFITDDDPRFVAIEPTFGVFNETTHGHKGWLKPIHRFTPVVNGSRSEFYLFNSVKGAVDSYEAKRQNLGIVKPSEPPMVIRADQHIAHVPYTGMVKKLEVRAVAHEWRKDPHQLMKITSQKGQLPPVKPERSQFETDADYLVAAMAYSEHEFFKKKIPATPDFKQFYDAKAVPATMIPPYVGNTYPASIGIALGSLAEYDWEMGIDLAKLWIGAFGYGSECGAKAWKMTGRPRYAEVVPKFKLKERAMSGVSLKPEQWMKLLEIHYKGAQGFDKAFWEEHKPTDFSVIPPKDEFALVRIGAHDCDDVKCTLDNEEGARYYAYVA